MRRTLINIVIILGIVGVTFGVTKHFFPTIKNNSSVETDTVIVHKPYIPDLFEEQEKPETLKKYDTDTVKVNSIIVKHDTVTVKTDSTNIEYNSSYLAL